MSFVLSATSLLAAGVAQAGHDESGGGRLGQVVGGIRSSGGGGGGSSGGGDSGGNHYYGYRYYDRDNYAGDSSTTSVAGEGATLLPTPPPKLDLYAGVQKVFESDGAVTGELRLAFGRIALIGRLSAYRESNMTGPDTKLDLASGGAGVALYDGARDQLWFDVVFAGVRTSPPDRLVGMGAGVRVVHTVSPSLALFGAAYRYSFARDVQATEAAAGVQASFLRASYRVLDFDVGPALRGPEIGVALRF